MKKDKREDVEWMKWSKSRLGTENRRNKTPGNKQNFCNKDLQRRLIIFFTVQLLGNKIFSYGDGGGAHISKWESVSSFFNADSFMNGFLLNV